MMRKPYVVLVILTIAISLGFFTLKGFGKDEHAVDNSGLSAVSEKIDEVLKNQKDIKIQLEDIKNELDVIKIRASRR